MTEYLIHPESVARTVLEMLKPKALLNPSSIEIKNTDSEFWEEAIDFSETIHARLPFLKVLRDSKTWSNLSEITQTRVEADLTRERMILAALDFELTESLEILRKAEIPVLLLKGMDLGRRFYPNRMLRPMTDVDILVRPKYFEKAIASLLNGPYRKIGPFPRGRFRLELGRSSESPVVEIHKCLQAGDTEEEMNALWDRSKRGMLPDLGDEVFGMSAEDTIPFLVRHGAIQHLMESPVWLNDLSFLITCEPFRLRADWEKIIRLAARKNASTAMWFVLQFLSRNWETEIPQEVLEMSAARVSSIRRKFLEPSLDLEKWFTREGRGRLWVIQTRFLLRDQVGEALNYGIKRLRSRGWTAET